MIYFNNTTSKIYFYGNVINFYSIFSYNFIDIAKLNIDDNIKVILSSIFTPATNNNEVYYEDCKLFTEVKFTNLIGKRDIIINNDILSIEEFNLKYLNRTFNKLDLIIIDNTNEYHEIIS